MSRKKDSEGVGLPSGHTGSSFFRHILAEAQKEYPKVFAQLDLPKGKAFKNQYAEVVVQFEAMRVNSPQRSEIAKFIVQRTQNQLQFNGNNYSGKFTDYLSEKAAPPEFEDIKFDNSERYHPKIPFRGKYYENNQIKDLANLLVTEHKATRAVQDSLNWVAQHLEENEGKIDLTGQKFVILGASAELAPTNILLSAGATVLWIDIQSPEKLLAKSSQFCGKLVVPKDVGNILMEPRKIRAAIEKFAEDQAVHIGMFAYAGGESQEWRLAATMNAIVRSLDPSVVRSVSMLISPTAAAVVQAEDNETSHEIFDHPPTWQAILRRIGLLKEKAAVENFGSPVARAIVPIQGISYQAAQYVSKVLAAEVFATFGVDLHGDPKPVFVSANVAGITKTRSLEHPIFQAAFLGAKTFGVEIFEVNTTHALNNLLILKDLIHPQTLNPSCIDKLFAQQVHGGIYSRAYALDPMIRIATVMGLVKKPRLLLKLI